ncbi:MAG TPA: hypothetical protein DCR93_00520, partial [Cytophagales bacterium]|nr:hypothetical protein [Cytophagales bacterium]
MCVKKLCLFAVGVVLGFACQKTNETPAQSEVVLSEEVPELVDFNFHVKPILSDKCFACHGPDKGNQEAGLALHEPERALMALGEHLDRFAVVPGDTVSSLLVQRIYATDANELMPPPESNLVLTDYEKQVLTQWIAQGAPYKKHWSFIPPTQAEIPETGQDWARNEIDRFVAQGLEGTGLTRSPEAPKTKLLRRVSYVLTGLPPTAEDLNRFEANTAPDAYEREVDRLLASTAYAERMAQIWMDLARYADSHGYQDDPERFMWPWRDWVIHAYDKNLPYEEFVTWQLAGDLLPDAGLEQIIASGFNRNHKITYEGGSIAEEFRTEYVADRAQVVGTAFMGLTVECARCHDHKYDPVSQSNFFELFAFFNNVNERGFMEPVGTTPEPFITLTQEEISTVASFVNMPDSVPQVELMVMEEMPQPRQAYILARGQYDAPTTPVSPATPESILPYGDRPANRLGLAQWLFDAENPLTARVAVNRLWQQVFGSGIVATSYDFGNQGALPSHPELLDHLALQYQREGWDTKAMLKYLVMSATFRQSAKTDARMEEIDPENRLLARSPRIRLDAEMIRDQALLASGLLNEEVGGPSVKPYQPEGLWAETIGGGGDLRKYVPDTGDLLYRRSLYTFWKRTVPPPGMLTFDAANKDLCTV